MREKRIMCFSKWKLIWVWVPLPAHKGWWKAQFDHCCQGAHSFTLEESKGHTTLRCSWLWLHSRRKLGSLLPSCLKFFCQGIFLYSLLFTGRLTGPMNSQVLDRAGGRSFSLWKFTSLCFSESPGNFVIGHHSHMQFKALIPILAASDMTQPQWAQNRPVYQPTHGKEPSGP